MRCRTLKRAVTTGSPDFWSTKVVSETTKVMSALGLFLVRVDHGSLPTSTSPTHHGAVIDELLLAVEDESRLWR